MGIRTWTDEQEDMLRSLWRSQYTGRDIAEYFGVSRSAALGKAFRLGLLGKMNQGEKTARALVAKKRQRGRA